MADRSKTSKRDRGEPPDKVYQPVRAQRGSQISCQGWRQEAALRMLMNSLDEGVAEQPRKLIACGTTGKVLRDWDCYHETVDALRRLASDETLLIQSGKPAGVFKTQVEASRVLIANSHLSGLSATDDKPDELEDRGFAMSGHAAARGWTYVGSQGFLPAAFQTFDAVAQKHFGGNLAGKLIVSGGLGAAGGALPLAAGLLGAAFLGIEADGEKIKRRIRAGYCDYCVNTLDEALRILKNAVRQKHAVSVGLVGNCADVMPELAGRGVVPDVLTDQTSAHDLLNGYIPSGVSLDQAEALRHQDPQEYLNRARESVVRHFDGMLALRKLGSVAFEFGNNIQAVARECAHVSEASPFPDFLDAYLQPLLREGLAPVRWVAISGEVGDIRRFDDLALKLFPDDAMLTRWIPLARKHVRFQGLPARVCWLGPQERIVLAEHVNKLVAKNIFKVPIVIAMDQAAGYKVSPTAGSKLEERNEAASDRGVLNALLTAARGATWIAFERERGYWRRASLALVADGTPEAELRLHRMLKNGSGT
ncbi:MAG: urocanate hydratase [Acidobacteriota bacterium]